MKNITIICNWKLNGNKKLINIFLKKLINFFKTLDEHKKKYIKVIFSPPILYLDYSYKIINKNKEIYLCSQNVDINENGSFTGEISAKMLKDIGVSYVILGHSERRKYHNESDYDISEKFFSVKNNELTPILCIGENLNDYENLKTEKICISQINTIIKKYGIEIMFNSIIAYEPIWAIGTGNYASKEHINKVFNFIKNYLNSFCDNINNKIKFYYGGSISSYNSEDLINNNIIDGLLIGKSSLYIDEILNIINNYIK
ncbi:triosephosphate isomerase [endosymbiont of Sipalinus gigas]|uniref:triose-phosphate isomerase n=1 Tax=endosymbiont of Sipalinus gigas TaxID=1972134 RepID=UPI000DC7392D|nr:triose-phosphate isomerase [endosymbiont of Sipalinus gigas]BBA85325.1 triosephosphate isomerase [endosymbiont of Sipalinus gigas]